MSVLTFKGIFVALKNKRLLVLHYKGYTLEMCYKDELFKWYAFLFDGNDVMDEDNYKEEYWYEHADFNMFKKMLSDRYPGLALI